MKQLLTLQHCRSRPVWWQHQSFWGFSDAQSGISLDIHFGHFNGSRGTAVFFLMESLE